MLPKRGVIKSWRLKVILITVASILVINFWLIARLFAEESSYSPLSAYIDGERIARQLIFSGQCNASYSKHWIKWKEFNAKSYIDSTAVLNGGEGFENHKFDQRVSDSIAIDRSIPDTRSRACPRSYDDAKFRSQDGKYPSVSVIITFHNEARSALLRTIVSVLQRTRKEFLCEFILIDDFSDNPDDGLFLQSIELVTVLRNDKRQGLVRSRNRGAKAAHGDILVFLDSHCEANEGWLEPLIDALLIDGRRVVSPIIDIIDQRSFAYQETESSLRGGFDWDLVFKWEQLPEAALKHHRKYPNQPFATPMFAGGLFAMSRSYFFELGGYDSQMSIWGGENIEMSFRVWQCGGRLEIVPCSRVGHIFRSAHPYTFPGGGSAFVFARNTKRAAEIWLDDFKTLYYERSPIARGIESGPLDDRRELRQRLQCKPFGWYLRTVYPELVLPSAYKALLDGKLRNSGALAQGSFCIAPESERNDPEGARHSTRKVGLSRCNPNDAGSRFEYDDAGTLRHYSPVLDTPLCLTVLDARDRATVYLSKCVSSRDATAREGQRWLRVDAPNEDGAFLFRTASSASLCLASRSETGGPPRVIVEQCNPSYFAHRWRFRVRESVR